MVAEILLGPFVFVVSRVSSMWRMSSVHFRSAVRGNSLLSSSDRGHIRKKSLALAASYVTTLIYDDRNSAAFLTTLTIFQNNLGFEGLRREKYFFFACLSWLATWLRFLYTLQSVSSFCTLVHKISGPHQIGEFSVQPWQVMLVGESGLGIVVMHD